MGVLLSLGASTAMAQRARRPPTEAEITESRALFIAGQGHIEAGRWADAAAAFSRSYDLAGVPAALFNEAYALRALGRYRRSRDAFVRLLTRHREQISDEVRTQAETYLAEVGSRVAALVVAGLPPPADVAVVVDGEPVEDNGDRPLPVELDPGSHSLLAEREAGLPFSWTGQLAPGERLTVEAVFAAVATSELSGTEPDQETDFAEEDGTVFESGWFWAVVGLVVAGAGAAVAYWFLHDDQLLEPMSERGFAF